ncbi:hypothetical protein Q2T41_08945 [Maribacter confluentis]|uniref:Lipoprotein n=1 Tax=Maribacter confluentis TaxID=1656093 RepID=A0ABT8RPD3_9FLAO|nr:hypothetical protein [Maribacter confluentis]MDO1512780.1 hypothetical protein [Maribacter confluentis]
MKKLIVRFNLGVLLAAILSCGLWGCGASKTHYQREYAKVWKELIKSQAWKESLMTNASNGATDFYTSAEETISLAEDNRAALDFDNRYQELVSKAYFKIITEAEKADAIITAEYKLIQSEDLANGHYKKRAQEITKKYNAHKAMLSGLKSWNIFSEDRSGDLKYFKAENERAILKMMRSGEQDHQMVNYLIYKLADLYHVEEN